MWNIKGTIATFIAMPFFLIDALKTWAYEQSTVYMLKKLGERRKGKM